MILEGDHVLRNVTRLRPTPPGTERARRKAGVRTGFRPIVKEFRAAAMTPTHGEGVWVVRS